MDALIRRSSFEEAEGGFQTVENEELQTEEKSGECEVATKLTEEDIRRKGEKPRVMMEEGWETDPFEGRFHRHGYHSPISRKTYCR